jgi:hypothetical protein
MNDPHEVEKFLSCFKEKMEIWGILYRDDRGKNAQALLDLEISANYRTSVLRQLKVEDYSEGPVPDTLYKGSDMWVFGKIIRDKEVYIKISLGLENAEVIVMSFHIADHPIKYPLKRIKL